MAHDDEKVTLTELSGAGRHFEIAYAGNCFARLHCEVMRGEDGGAEAVCRLYFEGDVRPEVMREILDCVNDQVVSRLPRGACIVYRAHLVARYAHGTR